MFTRKELQDRLPALLTAVVPLKPVQFDQNDFDPPDGEESIALLRLRSDEGLDLMAFWVSAVVAEGWEARRSYLLPYLESARCRPISELEFNALVSQHSSSLIRPLSLPLHPPSQFVCAMQMDDDWHTITAIAEYADEFISFHWETTA